MTTFGVQFNGPYQTDFGVQTTTPMYPAPTSGTGGGGGGSWGPTGAAPQAPAPVAAAVAPAPASATTAAPATTTTAAPAPVAANTASELERIKQAALAIQAKIPGATAPTVGDALGFNAGNYDKGLTYEQIYGKPENERDIMRNQMKLFQTEIDATNKVYDQMLAQEKQQGLGRVGSTTAMQARAGIVGSDFDYAQDQKILDYNKSAEGAIQNQRRAKIGAIMGNVRKAVQDQVTEKRLARQQGAENYIAYLASASERKQKNLSSVASDLLDQGIDPVTMDKKELDEVAKMAGVSTNEILAAYRSGKKALDAQAVDADLKTRKTEAEIAKLNDRSFSLSEGQAQYDASGKMIASRAKTYKPESGGVGTVGGGYTPGADPVTDAWVARISRGDAKITNVPAKYKNAVVVALEQSTGVTLDEDVQTATEIKRLAEELKGDREGLTDAVGPISSRLPTFEGSTATYENKVERLKALISKSNLQTMRGLGSMSNIEFQNMQAIGSALGLNMGEKGFEDELQRIIDTTGTAVTNSAGAKQTGGGAGTVLVNPATGEGFDASDLSAEEYQQALDDGYAPG